MIAPSEKHLEDWIANNLPLVGEYFEAGIDGEDRPYEAGIYPFFSQVIARQFNLPTGRCDLILQGNDLFDFFHCPIVVAELKLDCIDAKAILQLMRYTHDLKMVAEFARTNVSRTERRINGVQAQRIIKGCLIGHSCTDDLLLAACNAYEIDVFLYHYEANEDTYGIWRTGYDSRQSHQACKDITYGSVGQAIVRRVTTPWQG